MRIYTYDEISKAFTGAREAQLDPLSNSILNPKNATTKSPPVYDSNTQIPIYNPTNKDWDIIKLCIGNWYSLSHKMPERINTIFDCSDVAPNNYLTALAKQRQYNFDDKTQILTTISGEKYVKANPLDNDLKINNLDSLEYDTNSHKWIISLDNFKKLVNQIARFVYNNFCDEVFSYNGNNFQTNSDSLTKMQSMIDNQNYLTNSVVWVDSNNNDVNLSYPDLKELYFLIKNRNENYYLAYQNFRNMINSFSSINDLISKYPTIVTDLNNNKLSALSDILSKTNLTLDEYKNIANIRVNAEYDIIVNTITKDLVPNTEMLTWDTQQKEATDYLASKDVSKCPTISMIAKARGVSIDDLANKIIQKNTLYKTASAYIIGLRQKCQDEIQSATSQDELNNIKMPDINTIMSSIQEDSIK